mgnify:CR=1 FL=1
MDWLFFGEISLAGLAMGGLYALIALGFVIIYKATRVIHFAIGQIRLSAAYLFLAFAGGMECRPGLPCHWRLSAAAFSAV